MSLIVKKMGDNLHSKLIEMLIAAGGIWFIFKSLSTDKSVLSFWLSDGIFQIMSKDAHINGYFGMKLNLEGKRALVTGASAGIGKGTAEVLAGLGVKCVIAARRMSLLEKLKEDIIAKGGEAPIPVAVDLFEKGASVKLATEASECLGGIDVLVNAAGRSKAPSAQGIRLLITLLNFGKRAAFELCCNQGVDFRGFTANAGTKAWSYN